MVHQLIEVGTTAGLLASLLGRSAGAGDLLLPAETLVASCQQRCAYGVNKNWDIRTGRAVLLALVHAILVWRSGRRLDSLAV